MSKSVMRPGVIIVAAVTLVCLLGLFVVRTRYAANNGHPADPAAASSDISSAELNGSAVPAESGRAFVPLQSDPMLDPASGTGFIVLVRFRLNQLPPAGKTEKLLFKYEAGVRPYPGWALALHRYETSLRPEVYWQSQSGKGGWFTFGEVELRPEAGYLLWMVATHDLISVYLDEEANGQLPEGAEVPRRKRQLKFLGGYDVTSVGLPNSASPFFIRSGAPSENGIRVDVSEILIAQAKEMPHAAKNLRRILEAGTAGISQSFPPDQIALWIREDGKDHSRFARSVGHREAAL